MESEMLQSPLLGLGEEDEADLTDWNLPLAFMKKRHCEKIEGSKSLAQSWRMKDRMKTVSVALVLCLNVGVDPPDVVKTTPCARLECWIGLGLLMVIVSIWPKRKQNPGDLIQQTCRGMSSAC
uniref:Raptor N-terminal CASPase-like domain-containing protein n=1 Tax=Felis catus TaxID=9685 RepID=A0ABI7ZNS2_FELCA